MKGKILILGGSGILSSAVSVRAVQEEYEVTCITRGNRDFALPQNVKIIHGDINNLDQLKGQLERYDAVLDFLTFDVDQMKKKLKIISQICKQYFFVSSATVYSLDDEVITEATRLGNDFWDYGNNKIFCENFLRENHERYKLPYTIIRPYVTYGNTRIPFGIIPDGRYWSLANRLLCNKPILMWDNGSAICTLTHTSDFAKGLVGLIQNPKAFNEAFHITSNEKLTWLEVLNEIAAALGTTAQVFSGTTEEIVDIMHEYKGILLGDKARSKVFDNSKIVNAVPEFRNMKPFSEGISETIQYYKNNKDERIVNYIWDGEIDRTIIKLSKENNIKIDRKALHCASAEQMCIDNRIHYLIGRYWILHKAYNFLNRIFRKIHGGK